MKDRCLNKSSEHWPDYGGRGIAIYPEWIESFPAFLAAVGPRPSPKHTLDRIENSGNYEPDNVHWATPDQQARNRRTKRTITFEGREMSLIEFVEAHDLNYGTTWERLEGGCSPEEILTMDNRRRQRPGGGFAPKHPLPRKTIDRRAGKAGI